MRETIFNSDVVNNKITVEREFDGPVQLVWKAWTDPAILEQWWAPKPFKAITKSMDFREGGKWLYYMLGPEGEQHWCKVDYIKIDAPKRFTGDDAFCDENGVTNTEFPSMFWDASFNASNESTKVVVVISFASKEDLEKIISLGFKEGFAAAHGNLDEWLKTNK